MTVYNVLDDENNQGKIVAMEYIAELLRNELSGRLPYLHIVASNNIMDDVSLIGSFDPREKWKNGILENSNYFKVMITPHKGLRWYKEYERITVEFLSGNRSLKFRKYTSEVCNVVTYIEDWISSMIIKLAEDKIKQD